MGTYKKEVRGLGVDSGNPVKGVPTCDDSRRFEEAWKRSGASRRLSGGLSLGGWYAVLSDMLSSWWGKCLRKELRVCASKCRSVLYQFGGEGSERLPAEWCHEAFDERFKTSDNGRGDGVRVSCNLSGSGADAALSGWT